ncbi:MAG: hypothetical protein Q7R71_01850 [bacterium]|nr:hypothetical protein [bacterium]
MSKQEKKRLKLIKSMISPSKIYELCFAVISDTEWAANAALIGGKDRRFRFTHGQLFDEATVGDVRT